MTDQQRFDALSCHGGWIQTPHLDRLAAEGVDLRGHFAQAPVCVPSRCSLFSGRYGHGHGVLENDGRLGAHEAHLFKVLRQQGYHLTYSGKNHLLPESEMIANFDGYDSHGPERAEEPNRAAYLALERRSMKKLFSGNSHDSGEYHDFPDEVTGSGVIAAETKRHLRAAPADQPWCVVTSFSDPHVPHLAPRRFESLYSQEAIPLPEWDESELNSKHPRVRVKRGAQGSATADEADRRRYLSIYGSMCSFVDELIGGIVATLRERPDAARTMIVFVSDHGDFCWHHGLVKKDLLLYDDLLHVPTLIHWPEQLQPQVIRQTLSEHVDILPTILELAGIVPPPVCQGRSLVPLLRGETASHRDEIHAEVCYPEMRSAYRSAQEFRAAWEADQLSGGPLANSAPFNVPGDHTKCVRTTRWKYIWFGDGFEELYDVQEDPDEAHNLAAEPEFTAVINDLRKRLADWLRVTADDRSESDRQEVINAYDQWDHDLADSR